MAKVLVLYYSMYGHIETMARAVAEGASKVDGAEVVVKRVPETMPPQLFEKAGGKTQTAAHYTENWRASLVPPVLAAVRNKPSHPPGRPLRITAW